MDVCCRTYSRNHAYTWQRITAMILVIGLAGHVITMRFLQEPQVVTDNGQHHYVVALTMDPGLPALTERLGCRLIEKFPFL